MKLNKLLENVEVIKIIGNPDCDVEEVKTDSNSITKNSLFVCLNGRDFDGHNYIKQAENYGATAVICEKELDTSLTQVIVDNSRIALSKVASSFYNHPSKKLKIIGITGTNGKTTTSHFIYKILKEAGKQCGLIGTLGVYYKNVFKDTDLTTPDPLTLHKFFAEMVENGINIVVMEVSAHAIYLDKLSGIDFEAGVFTNCTQDHLDFFENMEEYKKAKLKFFKENKCKFIVSCVDDVVGKTICDVCPKTITYGVDNPSDVFAIDIKEENNDQSFVINLFDCIYEVNLKMIGKFNVLNALGAATVCALLGVPVDKVVNGLEKVRSVAGRLECVYDDMFSVYVDYAHTPDGIQKSIEALKNVCKGKLICVFGCGGNRDRTKRPKMGEIVAISADFCIITTDNPRFEEPMDIIFDIEKGVRTQTKKYLIIQDRIQAIEYALHMAKEGDIVLIAGKGGEKYQEVLGIKKPYNDKDTIEKVLEQKA